MKGNYQSKLKNELEFYKQELIELAKTSSTYSEIGRIMRHKYKNINPKALNFSYDIISKKFKEWKIELGRPYIVPKKLKNPDYITPDWFSTDFGQIIIGGLFGDSTIHYTNFNLSITHSIKQESYFRFKADKLNFMNVYYHPVKKISGYTHSYPFFRKLRSVFYDGQNKIIPETYLKKLNALGLLIWMYDDGYFRNRKRGSDIILCSECYSINELKMINKYLLWKFGIISTITKKNRIYFPAISQRKLCNLFISEIDEKILSLINYKQTAIQGIVEDRAGSVATSLSRGVVVG